MPTTAQQAYTVWVCVDCYFEHHGVLEPESLDPGIDRDSLLSLIDDAEVTSGRWPHEPGCPNVSDTGEWLGTTDCDCDRIEFTWSRCEGCGSTLGGSREALTVWYEQEASA